MAAGAFYIESKDFKALQQHLSEAQLSVARGFVSGGGSTPHIRRAFEDIGRRGVETVKQHVPVYGGQHSPQGVLNVAGHLGRRHSTPGAAAVGSLRDSITKRVSGGNVAIRSAWAGPLILQEFGGTSFWQRQASAGMLRRGNRRHESVVQSAARAGVHGHTVYRKFRKPRGYAIWNWAYHIRDYIGPRLGEGLKDEFASHDIELKVGLNGGLEGDLQAEPFARM